MLTPEKVEQLEKIVGKDGLLVAPDQRTAYSYDVGRKGSQIPDAVLFPSNVEQIASIMVLANKNNMKVLPEGSVTRRYLPSSLERTIVLSTSNMNRILDMDRESLKVTLEAGTTLQMLRSALDQEGLYFPPYPWCFETSTIGGCAANGIGGPSSSRHGVFKQFVLGMEVVLPSGEVTRIGGQTVKNVVGYDLTSLFCGSEGSLGLISALTLRLTPKPRSERVFIVEFPSTTSACAVMKGAMGSGRGPERISMLDPWMTKGMESFSLPGIPWGKGTTVLCQIAGLEEVVESETNTFLELMKTNKGTVNHVVQSPSEIETIWHAQGRCLSSINKAAPSLMSWDIIVPYSRAVEMMKKCGQTAQRHHVTLIHGGYYGNGVFHPVALLSAGDKHQQKNAEAAFAELVQFALSVGGNAAGPFRRVGIETAKFQTSEDKHMRRVVHEIKKALDPGGVMKSLPLSNPSEL